VASRLIAAGPQLQMVFSDPAEVKLRPCSAT